MILAELRQAEAMEQIYFETKHNIFHKLFQLKVPLDLIKKAIYLSLKKSNS
jgi:hypothetical protein